jgi:hypothetical protein
MYVCKRGKDEKKRFMIGGPVLRSTNQGKCRIGKKWLRDVHWKLGWGGSCTVLKKKKTHVFNVPDSKTPANINVEH